MELYLYFSQSIGFEDLYFITAALYRALGICQCQLQHIIDGITGVIVQNQLKCDECLHTITLYPS